MRTFDRITEICNTLGIDSEEITILNSRNVAAFSTWEFYEVMHFTNAELYYVSDEEAAALDQTADEIHETEKGIIYCYK